MDGLFFGAAIDPGRARIPIRPRVSQGRSCLTTGAAARPEGSRP